MTEVLRELVRDLEKKIRCEPSNQINLDYTKEAKGGITTSNPYLP